MKTISLLHPFSAQAIGLKEADLYVLHSKPHENALRVLQTEGYGVTIDYFTGRFYLYTKVVKGIRKQFWPISSPLLKKRHRWRKQKSYMHYLFSNVRPPDLTIINMSGHGSPYIFKLAKLLVSKQKPYIAMLGGMHISTDPVTMAYYSQAHHIIVHTNIQKQALLQNPKFAGLEIAVMPLGIDTNVFKPNADKTTTGCNLLYVGRISKLKQIELAIDAVAYLKTQGIEEVLLNIVGPSSDLEYLETLHNQVETLNVSNNIRFIGTKTQEELIPYYQHSDLLLLPSSHESFGMVMVEAMACGTPVVALKGAGGPEEIIEHGVNGFLCSKAKYNHYVHLAVSNTAALRALSEQAISHVNEKWSLEATVSSLKTSIFKVFN